MIRFLTFLLTVTAPVMAFAHPGHLADDGSGHSHWLALAIFGGLALVALGFGLRWFLRRGAKRLESRG
ncbi:MAG: hypothetical protein MI753_07765 [Hyphomicrobiales bacterium]|nr:hypothetical protein [Hyphomicrobiales bacterium]